MKENLDYLNTWEKMVINKQIEENQFLTSSTPEGLRVTISSTLELSEYLLHKCNFRYILTNKMNQDPLEVSKF